jgi:uncharacterized membrane protein HdeD (DUF308 family)
MKKIFSKWKWMEYVDAILLIVLGILVICFNSNSNLHAAIGYIVGVYLLINAVLLIVASLMLALPLLDGDFIMGLILLTVSIWLFVYPTMLIDVLPLILGVILIGYGLVLVTRSIILFATVGGASRNVGYLVSGILVTFCGVLLISLEYSGSANVTGFILVIFGAILLVAGLVQLISTIYIGHHARKISKAIGPDVVASDDKNSKK